MPLSMQHLKMFLMALSFLIGGMKKEYDGDDGIVVVVGVGVLHSSLATA